MLDPPFEDDDVGQDDEEGGFDMECSYAIVQSMFKNIINAYNTNLFIALLYLFLCRLLVLVSQIL